MSAVFSNLVMWRKPADAYLIRGKQKIPVEVSSLFQHIHEGGRACSREGVDQATLGLAPELERQLGRLVPEGFRLVVGLLRAPLLQFSRTKRGLRKALYDLLSQGNFDAHSALTHADPQGPGGACRRSHSCSSVKNNSGSSGVPILFCNGLLDDIARPKQPHLTNGRHNQRDRMPLLELSRGLSSEPPSRLQRHVGVPAQLRDTLACRIETDPMPLRERSRRFWNALCIGDDHQITRHLHCVDTHACQRRHAGPTEVMKPPIINRSTPPA